MKLIIKSALLIALQAAPSASGADELGRLFFTPQQRSQFEQEQEPLLNTDNSNVMRRELAVNGIVQRNGGQRTVWIDGVAQLAGKSDERSPESLPVAIPGQKQPMKVKVGQRVLLSPASPNTPKPDTAKQGVSDED